MDIYRTCVGPFPGCPSYDALKLIYREAQPPLLSAIENYDLDALEKRQSIMFFPRKAIKDILDEDRIKAILKCDCVICVKGREFSPPRFKDLVHWVENHGKILLAILIYLGHTYLIKTLGGETDRVSDDRLEAVPGVLSSLSRRPVGMSPNFHTSYKSALHLFQPRTFTMGSPSFRYGEKDRFPYLNEKSIDQGSFGEVFQFEIHPDYLDKKIDEKFKEWSPTKTTCVFVRKMLNKRLDDDDLQMEEDVLRVIDEQNHNNIMNIIAFYSWRDQVNFVFPCVDRNLYQVLHQDWKPENFPMPQRDCRGHWLWEQLIDVADALRTIHNPPKNPWPELGKIVGFHFDLKPANIMARRDGRLLVTDFGQSMVKFVQNNQPAYGDYIGGDYGYQPPEVCPSRTQWKEIKEAAEHSGSPVPTSPSIMTVTSFPPPPRKDSHATVSSVYSRRESRRGLGSFSGVSTAANESILSHGTSSSQSQLSPSTYSEVSRVTATTNYDVWSLACIMLEAFVFIYRGGSSGIEAFESDRRAEERALSFHDGNGANARLKTCVDRLLDEFRTLHIGFSDPTPRQQSYLGDVVDMLYGMFRSDPLCRISSEDVVTKLKEIKIEHAHDDAPDDPILRRMNTTPTPPGFTEVGWSRAPKDPAPVFLSFYQMSNVEFEIVIQTPRGPSISIVEAKLQIFYKPGRDSAFRFKIGYMTSDGPNCLPYTFSVENASFFPLYLYDTVPNRQNACELRDRHDQVVLRFGTVDELVAFQTVIMRYYPVRGLRIDGFQLQPLLGKVADFTFSKLNEPSDCPWPRSQIWESRTIEEMILPSLAVPPRMGERTRILILFCDKGKDFIGIPLMNGGIAIQEELAKAPDVPAVKMRPPDRWTKHFHFIRPPKDAVKYVIGAPSMALDLGLFIVDKKEKTRQVTEVTIKFSEDKYLRAFYKLLDETNKLNPFETNVITYFGGSGSNHDTLVTAAARSRANTFELARPREGRTNNNKLTAKH